MGAPSRSPNFCADKSRSLDFGAPKSRALTLGNDPTEVADAIPFHLSLNGQNSAQISQKVLFFRLSFAFCHYFIIKYLRIFV